MPGQTRARETHHKETTRLYASATAARDPQLATPGLDVHPRDHGVRPRGLRASRRSDSHAKGTDNTANKASSQTGSVDVTTMVGNALRCARLSPHPLRLPCQGNSDDDKTASQVAPTTCSTAAHSDLASSGDFLSSIGDHCAYRRRSRDRGFSAGLSPAHACAKSTCIIDGRMWLEKTNKKVL